MTTHVQFATLVKYIVKYMGYTKYIESQGDSWDTENIHQDSVNPC